MRWGLGPAAAKSGHCVHRSAQNFGEMFLPLLSKPPNTKKSQNAAENKFLCTSDNQVCNAGLCKGWILEPGFGDFLDLQSLWKVCIETPAEPQQFLGAFSRKGAGSCPRALPRGTGGMESKEAEAGEEMCFPPYPSTMGHSPFSCTRDERSDICTPLVLSRASFMPLHPLEGNISLPNLPTLIFKAIPAPQGFENPTQSLQSGAAGGKKGKDGKKQGMGKGASCLLHSPEQSQGRVSEQKWGGRRGREGRGRFWICWGWQGAPARLCHEGQDLIQLELVPCSLRWMARSEAPAPARSFQQSLSLLARGVVAFVPGLPRAGIPGQQLDPPFPSSRDFPSHCSRAPPAPPAKGTQGRGTNPTLCSHPEPELLHLEQKESSGPGFTS